MHYSKSYSKKSKPYFSTLIKILLISISIVLSIVRYQSIHAAQHKIAVIIPLEHESLKHIVEGIEEILNKEDCSVIVKNAQGDLNLMYSILNHLNNQDIDIIIPIGTQASQMAISIIKKKLIIATAAIIDIKNHLVTGINDEVSAVNFLVNLPKLKNIGVIYSNNEKITPEIEELKNYAKRNNLVLHLRMINTLLELPSSVKTISNEAQSFLILKDHLIVSGINIILQEAEKRSIPVIASDEGSVIAGAAVAFGVEEKEIGNIAGKMAKDILNGKAPINISYQTLDKSTLFVNEKSFKKQNILKQKDLESTNLPQHKIKSSE